jgi:hypothetical protein
MKRIALLVLVIIMTQACKLHSTDETILAEYSLNNGNKIKILRVSVGATANDNIQVRKDGQNSPLWVSEIYDTLLFSKLTNDTSLALILGAKGQNDKLNKIDTLNISIH